MSMFLCGTHRESFSSAVVWYELKFSDAIDIFFSGRSTYPPEIRCSIWPNFFDVQLHPLNLEKSFRKVSEMRKTIRVDTAGSGSHQLSPGSNADSLMEVEAISNRWNQATNGPTHSDTRRHVLKCRVSDLDSRLGAGLPACASDLK